jgi:hypothetical protein
MGLLIISLLRGESNQKETLLVGGCTHRKGTLILTIKYMERDFDKESFLFIKEPNLKF